MRSAGPAGDSLLSYAPVVMGLRQSTCRTGCGILWLSPSELKGCLLLCVCMKPAGGECMSCILCDRDKCNCHWCEEKVKKKSCITSASAEMKGIVRIHRFYIRVHTRRVSGV